MAPLANLNDFTSQRSGVVRTSGENIELGRKLITIAETEMPGMMSLRNRYQGQEPLKGAIISGSLHMTVETAVLIETLEVLGADVRWCSCNIYSTHDAAASAVNAKGTAKVFAWKGETLPEYWWCTLQSLQFPAEEGAGRCQMIVDDGGDASCMLHEGIKITKRMEAGEKLNAMLNEVAADNHSSEEAKALRATIVGALECDPSMFLRIRSRVIGASEETTTGVKMFRKLEASSELLFPVINVNDSVTKSKFDNLYGCRHSLPDGLMRATDVLIGGKSVCIMGFGDVGKGCADAMRGQGARVYVTECDPICALQAAMEGFKVVRVEDVLDEIDIWITATGNKDVLTVAHIALMKDSAIIGNIGHFDDEIQVAALMKYAKSINNIKDQYDAFVLPNGKTIYLLAMGRLLNLGCATGHPAFVMSCSFTNQVLAQLELWNSREEKAENIGCNVTVLPKLLDEEVARLHLPHLNAKLTELREDQADYINVQRSGPFKHDTYRY